MITLSPLLAQHQRVTPQQVQFLKMLQLPVIALEQSIKQELETNPLLEEVTQIDMEIDQEIPGDSSTSTQSADDDFGDGDDRDIRQDSVAEREFNYDELNSGDYDGYKAPSFAGTEPDEQEDFPQRAEETFSERLMTQLRMLTLSDDELMLAEEIIGNIDDDGYLRRDLREIVDDLNKFIAATSTSPPPSTRGTAAGGPAGGNGIAGFGGATADSSESDDAGSGPSLASLASSELYSPPREEQPRSVASVATMSLEEMSRMSIEDLARLLEQGTAQSSAPEPTPAPALNGSAPEKNGTLPEKIVEPAFTVQEGEKVLHHIQRLDPPGVGARDLQECLLIQLELMRELSPTHKLAYELIRTAYNDFTLKHFEKICQRLSCSTDELRGAMEVIRSLNPKPGEGSSTIVENNYVTPDYIVEQDGGDIVIIPNDRNVPALRVNRAYQEMIHRGRAKGAGDKEARKFLREKLESAKWFIASIHQRRQTMMKVMRAIVDLQKEFFYGGPDHIRPMIYRDVADRIGMDVSTVCRVVNGKYAQTDYGTFELKYFFSEKLETTSGEEVSTKIVKSRIRELIEAEDKMNPLSDDELSREMKKVGFNVARRTVAKYREQMNLPIARLRRAL